MADCPDTNTQKIEYSGLSTLAQSKVLRAEIDSIDEANNCAEVTLLDTCEATTGFDFSAVPFDYLCEDKAERTADALLDGYKAFANGDMVYLLFLPETDSAGNQAYIIGHVDIRETKTCQVYEYIFITVYDGVQTFATIFDVKNACTLDIDAFINKDVSSPSKPATIPILRSTSFNSWLNYNFVLSLPLDESIFSINIGNLNDGYNDGSSELLPSLTDENYNSVDNYINDNSLTNISGWEDYTTYAYRVSPGPTTSFDRYYSYYKRYNPSSDVVRIESVIYSQSTISDHGIYFTDEVSSTGEYWIYFPISNEHKSCASFEDISSTLIDNFYFRFNFNSDFVLPFDFGDYSYGEQIPDLYISLTEEDGSYSFSQLPDARTTFSLPGDSSITRNFTGESGVYFAFSRKFSGYGGIFSEGVLTYESPYYPLKYFAFVSLVQDIGEVTEENPRTIQRHFENIDYARSIALKATIEEAVNYWFANKSTASFKYNNHYLYVFCPMTFKG